MPLRKQRFLVEYAMFLLASMFLLARPIGDMDELWNFNFGYNICNGLLPYSDFNCIVTPLSAYISALFLSLFGNNLFCFRIVGIILLATTFYFLFLLLYTCNKSRILSFVFASFMYALCYLVWIYNYNNLNLLLIILALLLEFRIDGKNTQPSGWCYFLIGLIYGAVFGVKQSVGALFLVYNAVFCLILWFDKTEKRCVILRFASSFIVPIAFAVYLVLSDSFYAFGDYAIAGIGTFSHKITYWEYIISSPINLVIGLTPLIVTVFSVISIIRGTSSVSRRFHIVSLAISWIGLSVAYPLCDYIHMCIGIAPFSVCAVCCLKPQNLKKSERIICAVVAATILSSVCIAEIEKTDEYKKCELNRYQGLLIEQDLEDNLIAVGRYIQQKEETGVEVLIADSYAAAYLLPLDKYYKDFCLLNLGNLGTQSVSELLWRENAAYLVRNDLGKVNRQSHFELLDYIVSNYKKTGEVLGFDIYETQ